MLRLAVRNLKPGMVLDRPVIAANGKILLEKGTELTVRAISLLTIWDIDDVFIVGDTPAGNTDADIPLQSGMGATYREFVRDYASIVNTTIAAFDDIRHQQQIPVQDIKEIAFNIYATVLSTGPAVMDYLLVREHNLADKIVQHSIMVAFLSSLIGRQFKLLSDEVNPLVLGALLHDVGKLVTTKAHEISGESAHVVNGGRLVIAVSDMPQKVLLCVLQHHECLDASGYPLGVKDEKIHLFARIVAVANIFHNTAYRGGKFNPFPAIERLSAEMFDKLDPCVCHSFITYLRESLINTAVLLSNGQIAKVVFFNPSRNGSIVVKTEDGTLLDLGAGTDIVVQHLLTGAL